MKTLYPHQIRAFDYCMRTNTPALFMEMRLGKTLVAIRSLKEKQLKRILIVSPKQVLESWKEELREEDIYFLALYTDDLKNQKLTALTGWCVTNYEVLRLYPYVCDLHWDAVVLDESTVIKNPRAKITKTILKGFEYVEHKYILSGYPAPNGPTDYYNQMKFLYGGWMGTYNWWDFTNKHFNQYGYDLQMKSESRTIMKNYLKADTFTLRRKDAGLGNKRIYETRTVEQTKDQKHLTKQVLNDFAVNGKETKWKVVVSNWLAQIAGGVLDGNIISENKVNEILYLLQGDLRNEKVVIFFRYNSELHIVADTLKLKKINYRIITGATNQEERDLQIRYFDSVLLCQIKCAKYGINLSKASTTIYYSNSYSLEDRKQSEDRIEHMQKEEPLLYIDLVTEGSVDEDVLKALRDKSVEAQFFMSKVIENFLKRTGQECTTQQ